jgi:lipoate-protein ligase B
MRDCLVIELGLVPYAEAWELQRALVAARKAEAVPDVLLSCQHPHVITLGRNGRREHLKATSAVLRQMGAGFHETDRGGDITYHGPGQLVVYPILNLAAIRRDVVWYVRQLEEAMIRTSAEFAVVARRSPGMTGVWVETPAGDEKLGAIGVHISRWITSHGLAYNVATDLRYFELIVPCGLAGKRATSLERLLGRSITVSEVAPVMHRRLGEVFGLTLRPSTRQELESLVAVAGACVG